MKRTLARLLFCSALLSALPFASCGGDGRLDESGDRPDANINSDPRNNATGKSNAPDSAGTGLSPDTAKRDPR